MTHRARHTDPDSSHEKMTVYGKEAKSREEQTYAALEALCVTKRWVTAAQIMNRANTMFPSNTRQERDVSRTLTTLYRDNVILDQGVQIAATQLRPGGKGRKLLHYRPLDKGERAVLPPWVTDEVIDRVLREAQRRPRPLPDRAQATQPAHVCEACGHVNGTPQTTTKPDPDWEQAVLF